MNLAICRNRKSYLYTVLSDHNQHCLVHTNPQCTCTSASLHYKITDIFTLNSAPQDSEIQFLQFQPMKSTTPVCVLYSEKAPFYKVDPPHPRDFSCFSQTLVYWYGDNKLFQILRFKNTHMNKMGLINGFKGSSDWFITWIIKTGFTIKCVDSFQHFCQ